MAANTIINGYKPGNTQLGLNNIKDILRNLPAEDNPTVYIGAYEGSFCGHERIEVFLKEAHSNVNVIFLNTCLFCMELENRNTVLYGGGDTLQDLEDVNDGVCKETLMQVLEKGFKKQDRTENLSLKLPAHDD